MKDNNNKPGFFSRVPLAMMIVLTTVLLTVMALVCSALGLLDLSWGLEHPAFEALFISKNEDDVPTKDAPPTQEDSSEAIQNSSETVPVSTEEAVIVPTAESTEQTTQQETTALVEGGKIPRPMNYVPRPACEIRGEGYYDDPMLTARNKDYDYVYGDDAYFEDALFIGDSRIQGIYFYSGIPADYAFREGVSLFKCKTMAFELSSTGETLLLADIFEKKQYKKIYLLFGLNELGDHTSYEYGDYYDNVVNWIKNQQPEAVITIMESTPLSTYKSDNSEVSEWRNNDNINSRNYWAAKLACDGKDVFYLDFYIPEFLDEKGGLSESCTNDGIHLLADHYNVWTEHIRSHCLRNDMWE